MVCGERLRRCGYQKVASTPVIILEGILSFYHEVCSAAEWTFFFSPCETYLT